MNLKNVKQLFDEHVGGKGLGWILGCDLLMADSSL